MALPTIDQPRNDGPDPVDASRSPALVDVAPVVSTADDWVSCPSCGMDVRSEALERHRATQH